MPPDANGPAVSMQDLTKRFGDFVALDARSGTPLFKHTAPRGIRASPLTFQVEGKQYVSVVATNAVVTLALP